MDLVDDGPAPFPSRRGAKAHLPLILCLSGSDQRFERSTTFTAAVAARISTPVIRCGPRPKLNLRTGESVDTDDKTASSEEMLRSAWEDLERVEEAEAEPAEAEPEEMEVGKPSRLPVVPCPGCERPIHRKRASCPFCGIEIARRRESQEGSGTYAIFDRDQRFPALFRVYHRESRKGAELGWRSVRFYGEASLSTARVRRRFSGLKLIAPDGAALVEAKRLGRRNPRRYSIAANGVQGELTTDKSSLLRPSSRSRTATLDSGSEDLLAIEVHYTHQREGREHEAKLSGTAIPYRPLPTSVVVVCVLLTVSGWALWRPRTGRWTVEPTYSSRASAIRS